MHFGAATSGSANSLYTMTRMLRLGFVAFATFSRVPEKEESNGARLARAKIVSHVWWLLHETVVDLQLTRAKRRD